MSKGDSAMPSEWLCDSRISGVNAPLLLMDAAGGMGRNDSETSDVILFGLLDPLVATMDGEDGGAGERVK